MARKTTIEAAARAYARAFVNMRETQGVAANACALELAAAHHDLMLACLDVCVVCDAGSCPGFIFGR